MLHVHEQHACKDSMLSACIQRLAGAFTADISGAHRGQASPAGASTMETWDAARDTRLDGARAVHRDSPVRDAFRSRALRPLSRKATAPVIEGTGGQLGAVGNDRGLHAGGIGGLAARPGILAWLCGGHCGRCRYPCRASSIEAAARPVDRRPRRPADVCCFGGPAR